MATILGLFAHPDDESMGPGGTLARYAAAGHRVAVLTATDGGAGRLFRERPTDDAGRAELKRVRREETIAACRILGAEHLGFLGWEDGQLKAMDPLHVEEELAACIRRERPDVVITFHGAGISFHPDHRVMTMATAAAIRGAALAEYYRDGPAAELPPHRTARLYLYTLPDTIPREKWPREVFLSPPAEITTAIDTREFAAIRWEAIGAHASQGFGPPFRTLYELGVFDEEDFVRAIPTPLAGDRDAGDLLAGIPAAGPRGQ